MQDQRSASGARDSTVGESWPIEWATTKDKLEDNYDIHGLSIPQISSDDDSHPGLTPLFRNDEFHIESRLEAALVVEHQFITRFSGEYPVNQEERERERERADESAQEISVSLQLGEPECKKRKLSDSPNSN